MARKVFQYEDINTYLKKYIGDENCKLAQIYQKGFPCVEAFVLGRTAFDEFKKLGDISFETIEKDFLYIIEKIEEKYSEKFGDGNLYFDINVEKIFKENISLKAVGLNEENFDKFSNNFENKIDAYKIYIEYIISYFVLVGEMEKNIFTKIYDNLKKTYYQNITIDFYKKLIDEYLKTAKNYTNIEIPKSPMSQLIKLTKAIYKKWFSYEEFTYRRENANIGEDFFINYNKSVFFEKNSISFKGEVESVEIDEEIFNGFYELVEKKEFALMKKEFPGIFMQIQNIIKKLKFYFKSIFLIKFIVEDGVLYFYDYSEKENEENILYLYKMVKEGLISKKDLIEKIDIEKLVDTYGEKIKKDIQSEKLKNIKHITIVQGIKTAYLALNKESLLNLYEKSKDIIFYLDKINEDESYFIKRASAVIVDENILNKKNINILKNFAKPCIAIKGKYNNEKKELLLNGEKYNDEEKLTIDFSNALIYRGNLEKEFVLPENHIREIISWYLLDSDIEISPIFEENEISLYKSEFIYSSGFYSVDKVLESHDLKDYICEVILEKKEDNFKYLIEKIGFKLTKIFEGFDGKELFLELGKKSIYSLLPNKNELERRITIELKKHNIDNVNKIKKLILSLESLKENSYFENKGMNQINDNVIYELVIRIIFSILKKRTDLKIKLNLIMPYVNSEKEFENYKDLIQNIAYEENYLIDKESLKIGLSIYSCGSIYWKKFEDVDFVLFDSLLLSESLSSFSKMFYNAKRQYELEGLSFEDYNKEALNYFLNESIKQIGNLKKYIIVNKAINHDLLVQLKKLRFNGVFTDVKNMIKLRLESFKKGD